MTHIKSYVVRQTRMSDSQRRGFEQIFPKYKIDYDPAGNDLYRVVGNKRPIILEIGFGMGDATAEIAAAFPDFQFVGVEVHKPGIGKLARKLENEAIYNVRIIYHDAVEVVRDMTAGDSLRGIHIFFPDPWPKKRHHKRRLLQPTFVRMAAERLQPGGYLYVVTDWEDYAEQILANLEQEPLLSNTANGYHPGVTWRPKTAFEAKAAVDKRPAYELFFTRLSRPS